MTTQCLNLTLVATTVVTLTTGMNLARKFHPLL